MLVVLADVKLLAQKLGPEFEGDFNRNNVKTAIPVAEVCDAERFQHHVGNHVNAD